MSTTTGGVFGWRKRGLVIGDEYDSRLTPGIPATLSKYGFDFADPEPFDQESVVRVRDFLASAPKTLTPRGCYSYGLKHVVEEALGQYVANGDCIAACILSGFVVKQDSRTQASVNAMIGISKRWMKKQIAESKRRELHVNAQRSCKTFGTLHIRKNQDDTSR